MPTTPNGVRYPGNPASEPPNGPLQMGNIAQDVDTKLVGRFATTAALNSAYPNPIRGQIVTIGHVPWVRTSVMWAPLSAGMRAQRETNTPGFPHDEWTSWASNQNWTELDPYGMHGSGATVNAPWTGWYQLNATVWWNNDATGIRGIQWLPSAGLDLGEGGGQGTNLAYGPASSGGRDTVQSGSIAAFMQAGQTAQLQGIQTSGGQLDVDAVRISVMFGGPA